MVKKASVLIVLCCGVHVVCVAFTNWQNVAEEDKREWTLIATSSVIQTLQIRIYLLPSGLTTQTINLVRGKYN